VDVLRVRHAGEVEAGQQGELLEEHRPLPPRTGLADRQPAERERRGLLECGAPCAEVRGSQQPTVRPRERADRLGDEALVEAGARLLELLLARAALGFRDDPAVRLGELRIAKATARARRRPTRGGAARPAGSRAACPERPGNRPPRTRWRTRGRPRGARCRTRAGAAASRRRPPERTRPGALSRARARAPARGSARSWP